MVPAKDIVEVRPNMSFHVLVRNFSTIIINVPKHMVLLLRSEETIKLFYVEQIYKERRSTAVEL